MMDSLMLSPNFHRPNARVCLEASEQVYAYNYDLATALCHARLFEEEAYRPGAVDDGCRVRILAFRGSASLRDWLTDAQFERTAIGAGQELHRGFLDAIISANDKMLRLLPVDSTPVFVTGHSLGGAMALLAAKVLLEAGRNVVAVYTFGGPRVGNKAWARHYNSRLRSRTWRVVNEEDIVPRIPGVLVGYRHAGHEVFLPTYTHSFDTSVPHLAKLKRIAQDFIIDPPLWTKLKSDLRGTWRELRRGRCAQLEDHHIGAYRARLAGIIEPKLGETVAK